MDIIITSLWYGIIVLSISILGSAGLSDLRHRIIPDDNTLNLMGIGIILSVLGITFPGNLPFSSFQYIISLLLFLVIYLGGKHFYEKKLVGGGDVKILMTAQAIYPFILGIPTIFIILLSSLSIGMMMVTNKQNSPDDIPFGAVVYLVMLVGVISDIYFNSFIIR